MPQEVIIKLKVDDNATFRLKDKVKLFENISNLPKEDQEILLELSQNQKALKGIRENKPMLLSML